MKLLPALGLLAPVACRPGTSPSDTGTPASTTASPPSTSAGEDRLQPVAFAFNGAFGFDPDAGTTRAYLADPGDPFTFEPWFTVEFHLVDPLTLVESTCSVTAFNPVAEVGPAPWWPGSGPTLYWALDLDEGLDLVDTCHGWDPDWGPGASELVAGLRWSLGVGEPAEGLFDPGDPDALPAWDEAIYGEGDWETHLSHYAVGAAFGVRAAASDGDPALQTWAWALGYEVDEDFALVLDPGTASGTTSARHAGGSYVLIPAEDIREADTLPRGVYTPTLLGTLPIDVLLAATQGGSRAR